MEYILLLNIYFSFDDISFLWFDLIKGIDSVFKFSMLWNVDCLINFMLFGIIKFLMWVFWKVWFFIMVSEFGRCKFFFK